MQLGSELLSVSGTSVRGMEKSAVMRLVATTRPLVLSMAPPSQSTIDWLDGVVDKAIEELCDDADIESHRPIHQLKPAALAKYKAVAK